MKSFKEVVATQREYHRDGGLNSVHRSSLLVPEIAGSIAEISFLNHFLIKRGYRNVACRITPIDVEGKRIGSRLFPVQEPRVYTFCLTGMVQEPTASYLVEFFAAENLYIPFPAVMVNHRGPGFLNTVHAYNRILNDVFEDDAINGVQQREASIDVKLDDTTDTIVLFTAGQQPCQGSLHLELTTSSDTHKASVQLNVPRFGNREVSLRHVFPALQGGVTGILKVQQPRQFLFYGRMLVGQRHTDGSLSANHSYYDSSEVAEYWDDDRSSYRLYPFWADLENIVRMYPVMSPGNIDVSIRVYDQSGRQQAVFAIGEIKSPGARFASASINALLAKKGIDPEGVASFGVFARPVSGHTPTRVNHQLVYGQGQLESSINSSLANPNVFIPAGKKGIAWGQVPVGAGIESWLGIVLDSPDGQACDLDVVFYGAQGEIASRSWRLNPGGSIKIRPSDELADELGELASDIPTYVWYVVRCHRPDLNAYVVSRHSESRHCSGEHSF